MKRFDYSSVKARLIERAKMDADSATILDDSAFSNLLDVFSEGISEVARYIEYNTNEKKWTNAQNLTSLTHMGKLIGRKRRRPTSAIGYVIVSHTDIDKVPRLNYYGQTFFDINQSSDYDDIVKNPDANYIQKSALVPWTCSDVYTIPKGTVFHTANNIQFISTEAVSIRVLLNPYSSIISSSSKYEAFIASGGWDGIKYLKVPVIQGIEKEADLGFTNNSRFQTFRLDGGNIEGAYNSISKNYFYVEVTPPGSNTKTEKWAEIQNIRLAGPYDKVYETNLTEDGTGVVIKFGDGISGYKPIINSKVVVHYLETAGAAGNINAAGQILDDVAFPKGYKKIDPRTNQNYEFLNCTNTVSISGGRDIEDYTAYKVNAPTSYLRSYTTAVKSAYEQQIMNVSPVLLSKLKCFPDTAFNASQVDTSFNEDVNDTVSNEVSVISNALNIAAIKADGTKFDLDTVNEEFIQPIIKTIGDIKGPNDTLSYIEPNFIKIAPSLKISTYDLNSTDADVYNQVSAAITAKYSIFNTDFKKALYSSEISHQASLLDFTDSVSTQIEALANVSYDKNDIVLLNLDSQNGFKPTNWKENQPGTLIAIPFNFDTVFASNKYKQGFKNYTVNSQYVLKVNLKFINNAANADKSRTFFLYDNRIDNASGTPDIQSVKLLDINNKEVPSLQNAISEGTNSSLGIPQLIFPDETADKFEERQVRVAQFNYISSITDDEFMSKAKSWTTQPFENRPYEIDQQGIKKRFSTNDVPNNLVATITAGSQACYKYNPDWIPYVDIIFNENYDNPFSTQYARGFFIMPLDYLGLNDSIVTESTDEIFESLSSLLKQFIEIKVFAIPKQDDIEPEHWQDIVFIDDDDIKVERNLKYQK